MLQSSVFYRPFPQNGWCRDLCCQTLSGSSNLNFFEKSRLAGGERHPTPETGLSHIPAKNDIRKTAKAVMPLRFKESLFLLCRDLTSTFEVQSPHAVARIFLAGYPPIFGMVYVSKSCCLKAIKIPPNFKSEVGECSEHSKSAHRNIVFFYSVGLSYLWLCACQGNILILSLAAQRKKGLISVINRLT